MSDNVAFYKQSLQMVETGFIMFQIEVKIVLVVVTIMKQKTVSLVWPVAGVAISDVVGLSLTDCSLRHVLWHEVGKMVDTWILLASKILNCFESS